MSSNNQPCRFKRTASGHLDTSLLQDPNFARHRPTIPITPEMLRKLADSVKTHEIEMPETFPRILGATARPPPHHYLSEYMGSYGSSPLMEQYWGNKGSLKVAGPYLKARSTLYNSKLYNTQVHLALGRLPH